MFLVPGSWFRVRVQGSGSGFGVLGSGFGVPGAHRGRASGRRDLTTQAGRNSELGTTNLEHRTGTLNTNPEPGTRNEERQMTMKILLSWSSGKDSAWALHLLQRSHPGTVAALLT